MTARRNAERECDPARCSVPSVSSSSIRAPISHAFCTPATRSVIAASLNCLDGTARLCGVRSAITTSPSQPTRRQSIKSCCKSSLRSAICLREAAAEQKEGEQANEALVSSEQDRQCDECDVDADGSSLASVHCTSCPAFLCHIHAQSHTLSRRTKAHHLRTLPSAAWKVCKTHPGELLSYYCLPCDRNDLYALLPVVAARRPR